MLEEQKFAGSIMFNESFCSMLPGTIQQIDLKTILSFEEPIY